MSTNEFDVIPPKDGIEPKPELEVGSKVEGNEQLDPSIDNEQDQEDNTLDNVDTPEEKAEAGDTPDKEAEKAAVDKKSADEEGEEKQKKQEKSALATPKPEPGKKDKKHQKDPMMELVDDMNEFVKSTNEAITNFAKDKAKGAWDKVQDTDQMKNLNSALDQAKNFANDKISQKMDDVSDSDTMQSARKMANELKDNIKNAFASLNNKGNTKSDGPTQPGPDDDDENELSDSAEDVAYTKLGSESKDPAVKMEPGEDSADTKGVIAAVDKADPGNKIAAHNEASSPSPSPSLDDAGKALENVGTSLGR